MEQIQDLTVKSGNESTFNQHRLSICVVSDVMVIHTRMLTHRLSVWVWLPGQSGIPSAGVQVDAVQVARSVRISTGMIAQPFSCSLVFPVVQRNAHVSTYICM